MPACGRPVGTLSAAALEDGHVSAARHVDDERIVAARAGIVARQRLPQPPGFDPHDGIGLRIEISAAAKRFDGNRIGLDPRAFACERLLDDESEKSGQPEGVAKNRVVDDAAELLADFVDPQ